MSRATAHQTARTAALFAFTAFALSVSAALVWVMTLPLQF